MLGRRALRVPEGNGTANGCFLDSPGRFFAVNEMKLIFCEFLKRYDIKLIPGTAAKRSYVGVFLMAETELKVLVRSRAKR